MLEGEQMSAKELFLDLGYELDCDDNLLLIYKKNVIEIVFQKDYKKYHTLWSGEPLSIDVKLHQAIHQQCVELGWIEQ